MNVTSENMVMEEEKQEAQRLINDSEREKHRLTMR